MEALLTLKRDWTQATVTSCPDLVSAVNYLRTLENWIICSLLVKRSACRTKSRGATSAALQSSVCQSLTSDEESTRTRPNWGKKNQAFPQWKSMWYSVCHANSVYCHLTICSYAWIMLNNAHNLISGGVMASRRPLPAALFYLSGQLVCLLVFKPKTTRYSSV